MPWVWRSLSVVLAAGEDLHKVLWLKSRNSEVWLERRTHYTRSTAVMSMVHLHTLPVFCTAHSAECRVSELAGLPVLDALFGSMLCTLLHHSPLASYARFSRELHYLQMIWSSTPSAT
jgi:hypothetical protein